MMSMQHPMNPMLPRYLLSIVKQTSPFEERVTKNGIQRDIHVVIKNSPFVVQLALAKGCEIDLNHVAFEATLLYDTEGDKGVDFVKIKPIEYKCVPSETGDQVAVELRIKVLTSQHEDMFFKVSIQGQDPITKQEIPCLRVTTAPIKVISKPEQLKKKQPAPVVASTSSNNSKKRTVNDMVVEAVTRIEKQQAEQALMMERLLAELQPNKRPHTEVSAPTSSWEIPLSRPAQPKDVESADFETSFVQLLKSFSAIDPNHRAEKVRRVARTLSVADNECFSELVDMLTSEGLGQDPGREARPMMNTAMYEKIDNIFFTSMMPPYGANTSTLNTSAGPTGFDAGQFADFLGLNASNSPGEYLM